MPDHAELMALFMQMQPMDRMKFIQAAMKNVAKPVQPAKENRSEKEDE